MWRNSFIEFSCLPFGLAVAPRIFAKIMKPAVALLRRSGIRMIINLDDILFMSASKEGLQQYMATEQYLLENLDFLIYFEKLCFLPNHQLKFLGFVVHTSRVTIFTLTCKKTFNIHMQDHPFTCEVTPFTFTCKITPSIFT